MSCAEAKVSPGVAVDGIFEILHAIVLLAVRRLRVKPWSWSRATVLQACDTVGIPHACKPHDAAGVRHVDEESPMLLLILGLVIFLGMHLLPSFAGSWRQGWIARHGERAWKGLFALVAIIGFVLIVWGFGQARQAPVLLYVPPQWLRHANELLTVIAFVLLAAASVPRNHMKAGLGHPMIVAVKVWAFGHLLVNGMLHEVVLFGAFLVWAIVAFVAARRRDRASGVVYPAGSMTGDALSVVAGLAAWALFAFLLHGWLIGVAPFA